MKPFDKEQVYDEKIAPLMDQIIGICREHDIPLLCSFLYAVGGDDEDDREKKMCTTHQHFNREPVQEFGRALDILRNGLPENRALSFMVISK